MGKKGIDAIQVAKIGENAVMMESFFGNAVAAGKFGKRWECKVKSRRLNGKHLGDAAKKRGLVDQTPQ